MQKIIFYIGLALILGAWASADTTGAPLPKAQDPEEFSRELELTIIDAAKNGRPIVEFQNLQRNNLIKNDPRDWESTLAKIVAYPEKYGLEAASIALGVAKYRGDVSKNPQFIKGSIKMLYAKRDQCIRRIDESVATGQKINSFAITPLASLMPAILEIGSPEILQEVLTYFLSPEEEKIGLINHYAPIDVAAALRNYGDKRNISQAAQFAAKLREVGKGDLADDIDRSIERIEKDGKRVEPAKTVLQNAATTKLKASAAKKKEVSSVPWILGIAITLLAATGALLALKRKG